MRRLLPKSISLNYNDFDSIDIPIQPNLSQEEVNKLIEAEITKYSEEASNESLTMS